MAECCAYQHAENGNCRVTAAFACQNQLTEGAAAQHYAADTHNNHAEKVPYAVGVSNGLICKTEVKPVQCQIANDGNNDKYDKTADESPILEHEQVSHAAHHAETAALRKGAYYETGDQSCDERSSHAAGTLSAECEEGGNENHQEEESCSNDADAHAFCLGLTAAAAKGESLVQQEYTAEDTNCETDKANNCVEVTAADTQSHAQGAAQEHESADHNAKAEDEAEHGRRAAAGLELTLCKSDDESSDNDADDLGTDILDNGSAVQLGCAGDVTDKAGNAETHICRVAKHGQQNCCQTGHAACYQQEHFFLSHSISPFLFL